MVFRTDIVAEARSWLGVPWRHQGRTRQGVDCAGLPILVAQALELSSYNPMDYPRRPDGTFVLHFRKELDFVKPADVQDGDVLVFAESGHPCHCGIRVTLYGQPAIVHAHAKRRQVIEESLENAKSVIGKPIFCFSYRGLED